MDNIKKIYKVCCGALESVEVEKTTKKQVYVERCKASGYAKVLNKEHVCVTPMEAIQEEKNRALTLVGLYTDRLETAKERLLVMNSLEEEYS